MRGEGWKDGLGRRRLLGRLRTVGFVETAC